MFVLVLRISAYKQQQPQQPEYRTFQISFVRLGSQWKSGVWQLFVHLVPKVKLDTVLDGEWTTGVGTNVLENNGNMKKEKNK